MIPILLNHLSSIYGYDFALLISLFSFSLFGELGGFGPSFCLKEMLKFLHNQNALCRFTKNLNR
jgi:hypothetical protein